MLSKERIEELKFQSEKVAKSRHFSENIKADARDKVEVCNMALKCQEAINLIRKQQPIMKQALKDDPKALGMESDGYIEWPILGEIVAKNDAFLKRSEHDD